MARLIADKHTEAVVRRANARRLKVWQAEVERTETPLLAWADVAEPTPAPPNLETVEDRLALRRRVQEGTFRRCQVDAERGAQQMAAARWYAYLCSLHPDAPPELEEYFAQRWRHGGPLMAKIVARTFYAKLLAGVPVVDDITVEPAPWFELARRHWLRADIPAAQRRADERAEVEAWNAAHPEETAAWEARRDAKRARGAADRVDYSEPRFA